MSTVRPWGRISTSPFDIASADSAMGHAADLALGIALAQPKRKVVCLNGDGSMLMSLGTLATIVGTDARNLMLFVMRNGVYEITGHQPIPASKSLDFATMAEAAGFAHVFRCETIEQCRDIIPKALITDGPTFVSVTVAAGDEGPISRGADAELQYLQMSLAESARQLRTAIAIS